MPPFKLKELVWGLSGLQYTCSLLNTVGKIPVFIQHPTTIEDCLIAITLSINCLMPVVKHGDDDKASAAKVSVDPERANEGRVDRLHCAHSHQGTQGHARWLWWWWIGDTWKCKGSPAIRKIVLFGHCPKGGAQNHCPKRGRGVETLAQTVCGSSSVNVYHYRVT